MVEAGNRPCDGHHDPDKARGTHLLDLPLKLVDGKQA